MKKPSIVLEIQSSYNQLTKAEKKVADFVLENQAKVIYMSITDLADACNVGDTTVYRFCRTMNLQGYQEFKMKLSLSLQSDEIGESPEKKITETLADRIMNSQIQAIRETNMLVDSDVVADVTGMMRAAENIYFFGIGDSLLTAEEARNKFSRITNKVKVITDPHMQAMAASLASKRDLFIFLSYSGATKDNIYVAQIAKEAGAKIVCITHYKKSPLTEFAGAVLLCGSKEGPLEGGTMAAKISQLYLIDLLYQEYYEENHDENKEKKKTTSAAVVGKLF